MVYYIYLQYRIIILFYNIVFMVLVFSALSAVDVGVFGLCPDDSLSLSP